MVKLAGLFYMVLKVGISNVQSPINAQLLIGYLQARTAPLTTHPPHAWTGRPLHQQVDTICHGEAPEGTQLTPR